MARPEGLNPLTHSTLLYDAYGRGVNSIRISVTQRCNLRCFFCHKEGELSVKDEMSLDEIVGIAKTACALGMRRVKLTGGEPLLRGDLSQIISGIARYAEEVALTTNGVQLVDRAGELRRAGLNRINVSLHSIDPQTYSKITGRNYQKQVLQGIKTALDEGLEPLKVNMVVLKGMNDDEISSMINLAADLGFILQLIEFQPVQKASATHWQSFHDDLTGIEAWLRKNAHDIEERSMHRRVKYFLEREGHSVCVEVVRPMHNPAFCSNCTRLRVTSDGKLKPCLLRNDNLVEAAAILRNGGSLQELEKAFRTAVELREPYWKEPR
jgi:cyclic pyranopterin phosphate synthase